MPQFLTASGRIVAAVFLSLIFTASSPAQMKGGSKPKTDAMPASPMKGNTGFGGLSGSGVDMNPAMNPYAFMSGYGTYGMGGGYGSYSSGNAYGSGGVIPPATPWNPQYGAWIQPAFSWVLQDDISRGQSSLQRSMMLQDYTLRKLQVRKAQLDQMNYERMNTPSPEAIREEMRMTRLTRARSTPPLDEIASGESLNELLTNIQRIKANDGVVGEPVPLDADVVKRINVTATGDSRGSNEFFRTGITSWPYAFDGEVFAADKKRLLTNISYMAKLQEGGTTDGAKIDESRKAIESMHEKLFASRNLISFTDYVAGLQFLTKLTDAVNLLAKPEAKAYLDGTYSAKGESVAELVDYLISKGLKFARASSGNESYYARLYQQLLTYELGLTKLAAKRSQSSSLQSKTDAEPKK